MLFLPQYLMDKHKLLRSCQTPVHYSKDMQEGLLGEPDSASSQHPAVHLLPGSGVILLV